LNLEFKLIVKLIENNTSILRRFETNFISVIPVQREIVLGLFIEHLQSYILHTLYKPVTNGNSYLTYILEIENPFSLLVRVL